MTKSKSKKKPAAKSGKAPAKTKVAKAAPKKTEKPQKEARTTKTSVILDALRQEDGATVEELAEAASWQNHSVRGFLSTLAKKGRRIEKFTRSDSGRTAYKLEAAGANG